MKYLYLHGLGQKPDSWNRVIKEMKVSKSSVSLSLSDMLEGKSATYKELYSAFSSEYDKENDGIALCGLSLGAVLALNYAIDHPDKVKALVLIAAQYKMPKKLLKIQNMLFHLMPNSTFNKMGFKKADVISLCGTMAELDFSDSLHKVSCPVLIVCGEKDKASIKTGYSTENFTTKILQRNQRQKRIYYEFYHLDGTESVPKNYKGKYILFH